MPETATHNGDVLLQIRRWKFSATEHAAQRYVERVMPVVGHDRAGDFCRECRLATAREARACRKSCPVASTRGEKLLRIYLWHEKTEIAVVGRPYLFQTRVDFKVFTFLDMGALT